MTSRVCMAAVLCSLAGESSADFRILDARPGGSNQVAISYPSHATNYYILYRGGLVTQITAPSSVHVPMASPDVFTNPLQPGLAFFAVLQRARNLPGDLDGDGMDDVYECLRSLNPLDPADASQLAPDGSGLTNYQEYRMRMGFDLSPNDAVSREISAVNYGGLLGLYQAVSREVSAVRGVGYRAAYEAIGREVSVFPDEGYSAAAEAVSREISASNEGGAGAGFEAVSREVSVLADTGYSAAYDAVSREVSVYNNL